MRTDAEICAEGLQALADALGPVEAERFVSLMLRESFDYTQWRQTLWRGKSVEQISRAAMDERKSPASR